MDGTVINGYLIQDDGGRVNVQTKTLPIVGMENVCDIKPASSDQVQNMLDRIDKQGYEWSDGRIRMKLPKTWDEFCKAYPFRKREFYIDNTSNICEVDNSGFITRNCVLDKNLLQDKETAEAFLALMQLVRLRDCYNDGWKPDWKANYAKHTIYTANGEIIATPTWCTSVILAFKSEELRDQFLENFRDLIEIAKPLI